MSNVHYRHKTRWKDPNGPLALPPFKSQNSYKCKVYMIIIPGKVVSANCVLNCLNPGIKFVLRRITKFQGENEKFGASHSRQNLVWQTVRHFNTCCVRNTIVDSSLNRNDLWRCPSRCLCRRRFLNCQLLATGTLRDCLHLNNTSMPSFLLLDQPLLKLLFPKQSYIPPNSLRPGTWRVVVTLKIPLFCNFSTSSVWLKVFRLLPRLYQVIWGRGRPLNIHFTSFRFILFS